MPTAYKTYRFIDKDPVIDELRTKQEDSGMSFLEISTVSGVSVSTLRSWWLGDTRRPQNATIEAAARAMGYERRLVPFDRAVKAKPSRRPRKNF